jgi:hypothetical protein
MQLIIIGYTVDCMRAGKTTSARVMASRAAVPLVYLPLEAVLSKWYGESEGQLAQVFKAAKELGGAIVFIVSSPKPHSTPRAMLICSLCTQQPKKLN